MDSGGVICLCYFNQGQVLYEVTFFQSLGTSHYNSLPITVQSLLAFLCSVAYRQPG